MTASSFDPVEGDRLKKLLDRLWSPPLAAIGLEPCGANTWAAPGDTPFRKIVIFGRLKGFGAIGYYGLSLSFVPTLGRNELTYHRTQKSAKMDVSNVYPPYYWSIRPVPGTFPEEIRLSNPRDAKRTLQEFIGPFASSAQAWFETVPDLDSLEAALRARIADNINPGLNPRPEYALAFIEAAHGNFEEARRLLESSPYPELREEFMETAFQKARAAFPSLRNT